MADEYALELEGDIETICKYLCEVLGIEEVDGDGDQGSVIVDHISRIVAERDALRGHLRYALAWFDKQTLAEFKRDAMGAVIFDTLVAEEAE